MSLTLQNLKVIQIQQQQVVKSVDFPLLSDLFTLLTDGREPAGHSYGKLKPFNSRAMDIEFRDAASGSSFI